MEVSLSSLRTIASSGSEYIVKTSEEAGGNIQGSNSLQRRELKQAKSNADANRSLRQACYDAFSKAPGINQETLNGIAKDLGITRKGISSKPLSMRNLQGAISKYDTQRTADSQEAASERSGLISRYTVITRSLASKFLPDQCYGTGVRQHSNYPQELLDQYFGIVDALANFKAGREVAGFATEYAPENCQQDIRNFEIFIRGKMTQLYSDCFEHKYSGTIIAEAISKCPHMQNCQDSLREIIKGTILQQLTTNPEVVVEVSRKGGPSTESLLEQSRAAVDAVINHFEALDTAVAGKNVPEAAVNGMKENMMRLCAYYGKDTLDSAMSLFNNNMALIQTITAEPEKALDAIKAFRNSSENVPSGHSGTILSFVQKSVAAIHEGAEFPAECKEKLTGLYQQLRLLESAANQVWQEPAGVNGVQVASDLEAKNALHKNVSFVGALLTQLGFEKPNYDASALTFTYGNEGMKISANGAEAVLSAEVLQLAQEVGVSLSMGTPSNVTIGMDYETPALSDVKQRLDGEFSAAYGSASKAIPYIHEAARQIMNGVSLTINGRTIEAGATVEETVNAIVDALPADCAARLLPSIGALFSENVLDTQAASNQLNAMLGGDVIKTGQGARSISIDVMDNQRMRVSISQENTVAMLKKGMEEIAYTANDSSVKTSATFDVCMVPNKDGKYAKPVVEYNDTSSVKQTFTFGTAMTDVQLREKLGQYFDAAEIRALSKQGLITQDFLAAFDSKDAGAIKAACDSVRGACIAGVLMERNQQLFNGNFTQELADAVEKLVLKQEPNIQGGKISEEKLASDEIIRYYQHIKANDDFAQDTAVLIAGRAGEHILTQELKQSAYSKEVGDVTVELIKTMGIPFGSPDKGGCAGAIRQLMSIVDAAFKTVANASTGKELDSSLARLVSADLNGSGFAALWSCDIDGSNRSNVTDAQKHRLIQMILEGAWNARGTASIDQNAIREFLCGADFICNGYQKLNNSPKGVGDVQILQTVARFLSGKASVKSFERLPAGTPIHDLPPSTRNMFHAADIIEYDEDYYGVKYTGTFTKSVSDYMLEMMLEDIMNNVLLTDYSSLELKRSDSSVIKDAERSATYSLDGQTFDRTTAPSDMKQRVDDYFAKDEKNGKLAKAIFNAICHQGMQATYENTRNFGYGPILPTSLHRGNFATSFDIKMEDGAYVIKFRDECSYNRETSGMEDGLNLFNKNSRCITEHTLRLEFKDGFPVLSFVEPPKYTFELSKKYVPTEHIRLDESYFTKLFYLENFNDEVWARLNDPETAQEEYERISPYIMDKHEDRFLNAIFEEQEWVVYPHIVGILTEDIRSELHSNDVATIHSALEKVCDGYASKGVARPNPMLYWQKLLIENGVNSTIAGEYLAGADVASKRDILQPLLTGTEAEKQAAISRFRAELRGSENGDVTLLRSLGFTHAQSTSLKTNMVPDKLDRMLNYIVENGEFAKNAMDILNSELSAIQIGNVAQ